MHNAREVYVIDGCRTPFLKAGAPGPFAAVDLAVAAGQPLLARQRFAPADFDEVILGCVGPSVEEANIGRVASLRLGCGDATPAWTVARNCASGMQALDSAATNIAAGRADLVLAGGTEAMSHAPVLFSTQFAAWLAQWARAKTATQKIKTLAALKLTSLTPVIGLLKGLTDPVAGVSMGQTAEEVAHRFGIDRAAMDAFAARSHQRLAAATDAGVFDDEIVPIFDSAGNCHRADTGLRRDSNVADLAKLRAVFDRPAGQVTAGNSAQITDGCAWLVLASARAVERHGLTPRGRLIDCCWAGLDPRQMGLGPVHASTPLLQRAGLALADIDYWEINEAFAAQVLGCLAAWRSDAYCREQLGLDRALGELDQDRLNLDGGGISLGHPVGASGARIVLHALRVLERERWSRAIATLCIGGGQGGAMLIERIAESA
ncbi:MAG: acetyl-CoA C-acetyltransferase [bacterium]